jgi:Ser/Thr protein kinase RdoA (MazF antagonist)
MTEICILPDFTTEQTAEIIERLYGLRGTLRVLNGERDLNFLLHTENGQYVFKIANQDEPYGMLECQHQVLQRLGVDNVMPRQASSIESVNGRAIEVVVNESGIHHYCRMLSYVEGQLLSSVNPHNPELLEDLGKTLAQIDMSLQGFTHEALERPLLWNMSDALTTLERFKPLLASDHRRKLITYFESHFRDSVLPLARVLREGVIHNDANDNNVLVDDDQSSGQHVTSIIDFGDMTYSWIAAEPAIAAAYAMLEKEEPLDAAAAIIKGYHAQLPLNKAEVSVLFDFICMRLCMSVCICAYQQSLEPDNEYLSISEKPAWSLLEILRDVIPEHATDLFRTVCK